VHDNSILIFRKYVAHRIPQDGRILELGPDSSPSSYCREAGCPRGWETADLAAHAGSYSWDQSAANVLMPSEYEIPVSDGSYDVVLSGQVVEHVREVWTWMVELARVTKAGGHVITISPISWPYHEAPVDCWRIYPAAMEALCAFAGLTCEFMWWGSLEPKPSRRTYPGEGADIVAPRSTTLRSKLRAVIGWPAPVSYDMVTVAAKPLPT
jgi:SAM-dependent methyltransferase